MRTFNFAVLAILGLFFASCGNDDDRLGDWEKSIEFSGAPRDAAVCFTDEETGTVFVGLGLGIRSEEFSDMYSFSEGNNGLNWSEVKSKFSAPTNPGTGPKLGNGRHSAVAFVIGDFAYVGTGFVPAWGDNAETIRDRTYFRDFYKFNMRTKEWVPAEDWTSSIPGEGRRDAVAFSDGTYGYVGTGYGENNRVFKDFYRFDPSKPQGQEWEEIEFPGDARYGGTVFVVNNAAYVCLGAKNVGVNGLDYARDVVKFDFDTKLFTKMPNTLTDKPGVKQDKDYDRIPRYYAVSFVSNAGKDGEAYGYVATGAGSNNRTVWKYNHKRDQWHQMEDLSSATTALVMGVGFTYKGFGYYTTGAGSVSATDGFYTATWKFIPDVKETRRNDY